MYKRENCDICKLNSIMHKFMHIFLNYSSKRLVNSTQKQNTLLNTASVKRPSFANTRKYCTICILWYFVPTGSNTVIF